MSKDRIRMEKEIDHIVNSELGEKYNVASCVKNINEIPFHDFNELHKKIDEGYIIVRVAALSRDSMTFSIISSKWERMIHKFSMFVAFGVPIVGLAGSFLFSWYMLSLIILGPLAFGVSKTNIAVFIWTGLSILLIKILPVSNVVAFWLIPMLTGLASIAGLAFRKAYLHALFHRAFTSEKAFSYLFTTGKITVEIPSGEILRRTPGADK